MTIFPQWEQFVALVKAVAGSAADVRSRRAFRRVDLSGGRGTLAAGAANMVALEGGSATLVLPEAEPGVSRDVLVRAECAAATSLAFEGGSLEADGAGALAPPAAGETAVYRLSETAPGVWLVSRAVAAETGEGG